MQLACGFHAWSQTALCNLTLTSTLLLDVVRVTQVLERTASQLHNYNGAHLNPKCMLENAVFEHTFQGIVFKLHAKMQSCTHAHKNVFDVENTALMQHFSSSATPDKLTGM